MASDRAFKLLNRVHRLAVRATRGRLGWQAFGMGKMPMVELTTTGRRSGQPRSVMLTVPVWEGDTVVLVASRFGDDVHPAWFLNVQDNPDVVLHSKHGRRSMRARIPTGDERAALWERVVRDHDNYAAYQKKTEREIPLVVLEPA
jgi:deazaflavin-dependent oxidoreductase (nitroreductase family)